MLNVREVNICRFVGQYSFLGNFYLATTWYEGRLYDYSETAYQAAKVADRNLRRRLFDIHMPPRRSKLLGTNIYYRPDWYEIRYRVMQEVVRSKFTRHPELKRRLLDTRGQLIEGNGHSDNQWGMVRNSLGLWEGSNWLGCILMDLREELRHVSN